MTSKRAAFVVEHDFIMATYLADKVIVFDGTPAKDTYCTSPEGLVTGMNRFLKLMDITFRRDPTNFRPRINKSESQKDQEQKAAGNYFLLEDKIDPKALKKKDEEEKEKAIEEAETKGAQQKHEAGDDEDHYSHAKKGPAKTQKQEPKKEAQKPQPKK